MKKIIINDWARLMITILRMAIGWHFLYEGISKLIIQDWTSYSYLVNTTGPLSGFYHWIALSPDILQLVDIINIFGLILIGTFLFVGLFTKLAAIAGTLLLVLYYFAYPPFGESLFNLGEGHLFIVDKIFIEVTALLFYVFSKEKGFGIDFLIRTKYKIKSFIQKTKEASFSNSRREALKTSQPYLFLV